MALSMASPIIFIVIIPLLATLRSNIPLVFSLNYGNPQISPSIHSSSSSSSNGHNNNNQSPNRFPSIPVLLSGNGNQTTHLPNQRSQQQQDSSIRKLHKLHPNFNTTANGTELFGQINKWLSNDDMNVGESRLSSSAFTDFDNTDAFRPYQNRSKTPLRRKLATNKRSNHSNSIKDDLDFEAAESGDQIFDDVDEAAGLAGTTREPACATHGRYYCTSKEEYPYKLVTEVTKYYKWPLEKLFRDLHAQIMPKLAQESTGNLVCDSITRVVRPGWARNTNDRWLVVINTENYHQYVTEVVCQYGSNSRCNFIPPCYYSSCQQRYNTQKLLVIDPNNPYRGPFLSEFLFPSCCVCYVPSTIEGSDDKYRSSPATIYQRTMQQVAASNIYPPQMSHPGSAASSESSYSGPVSSSNGNGGNGAAAQSRQKSQVAPPYDQTHPGPLAPGEIRRDGDQPLKGSLDSESSVKSNSRDHTVTHSQDSNQGDNDIRMGSDHSDLLNFPHFRVESGAEAEALRSAASNNRAKRK